MIKSKLRCHTSLRGAKRRSNHGFSEIASSAFGLLAMTLLLTIFCGPWTDGCAEPVTSTELISNARHYDGVEVEYTGEVIGDLMRRSSGAWVNVSDGANAIGVWAELSMVEDIVYAGAYQVQGDIVEVSGVFHRACPEHGGDLDIHADRITVLRHGKKDPVMPGESKKTTAVLLMGVLVLVWILTRSARK